MDLVSAILLDDAAAFIKHALDATILSMPLFLRFISAVLRKLLPMIALLQVILLLQNCTPANKPNAHIV